MAEQPTENHGWLALANKAFGLLRDRTFVELLLLINIGIVAFGLYFGITVVVPLQIKQIQAGYEKISETEAARAKYQEDSHRENVRVITEAFKAALDRDRRKEERE